MSIIDSVERAPHHFYNEKVTCLLGKGLRESGALNPEGRIKALSTLRRFANLLKQANASHVRCVATAAVRAAEDGPAFCEEVQLRCGIEVEVIDGLQEADLAAKGVLWSNYRADGIVCDIGGSSLEFCELDNGKIGQQATTPLGALTLMESQSPDALISTELKRVSKQIQANGRPFYLVGGGWRALLKADLVRNQYPLSILHNYQTTQSSLQDTSQWIAGFNDTSEMAKVCGISKARADILTYIAKLPRAFKTHFAPSNYHVSAYGLREGAAACITQTDLDADPLFRGASQYDYQLSRFPGFGEVLHEFLYPLFDTLPNWEQRIAHCAALLHDINWQIHPDYRAQASFNWPLQTSLLGITHKERLFLGLALTFRYGAKSRDVEKRTSASLLSAEEMTNAKVVGRALRFGAMLSLGEQYSLGQLAVDETTLRWQFPATTFETLSGSVVETRLNAVAKALGKSVKIVLT